MKRHLGKDLIILLLCAAWAQFAGARDIYVATNGEGGGDPLYGAWEHAASNIQWAVNAGTNGDTVWISNGTYYLTNQVTVSSNITICGNTGETVVLNGNNANRCINVPLATVTLSNLFITRGYASGASSNGGGVNMQAGMVLDCVFSSNTCVNYSGGGLYVYVGASKTSTVQRCTFVANVASNYGGGLAMFGGTAAKSWVDSCQFYTNYTAGNGGGMYDDISLSVITGCYFICNVASGAMGGVRVKGTLTHSTIVSNVAMISAPGGATCGTMTSNCCVSNNIGQRYGGGLSLSGGTVKNCIIARNMTITDSSSYGGGGIYVAQATSLLQDCIIEENTARLNGGGGVLIVAGTIRNCLIRNNVAELGGGIRRGTASSTISSCTIVSNYASQASSSAGGVYDNATGAGAGGQYENCIIYFNGIVSGSASNYYLEADVASTFTNCCLAPALPAGITSINIISNNPQFVASATGNYRLNGKSPCVNAGVNRDWMTDAVDLDGRIRIRYGTVDMGAYERIIEGTIYKFR